MTTAPSAAPSVPSPLGADPARAVLFLLVTGALLGTSTNLAKIATGRGIDPLAFLACSIVGASVLLGAITLARGVRPRPDGALSSTTSSPPSSRSPPPTSSSSPPCRAWARASWRSPSLGRWKRPLCPAELASGLLPERPLGACPVRRSASGCRSRRGRSGDRVSLSLALPATNAVSTPPGRRRVNGGGWHEQR